MIIIKVYLIAQELFQLHQLLGRDGGQRQEPERGSAAAAPEGEEDHRPQPQR